AAHAGVSVVSVMWANNETGVLQPIREIVELASRRGARVHSDAVQAAAHVPIDFDASGVSALRISGHKTGAPGGSGATLPRRGVGGTRRAPRPARVHPHPAHARGTTGTGDPLGNSERGRRRGTRGSTP